MLACSRPPDEYGHWTLDLLADRMVKLNYWRRSPATPSAAF